MDTTSLDAGVSDADLIAASLAEPEMFTAIFDRRVRTSDRACPRVSRGLAVRGAAHADTRPRQFANSLIRLLLS